MAKSNEILERLLLNDNELEGPIPNSIGMLDSIININISNNNLSGIIPESICDLSISPIFIILNDNQLCPGEEGYPSCIEDYIGYQDTSECLITGDLNNDSSINVQDIIVLVDIIINIFENDYVPTNEELQVADIYEDGQLNVIDIVGLVNIIFEQ